MAAEGLNNKESHSNYKTITLEDKIEKMESLGLSKEAPFREPNIKASEKRFMIKLQLLDMKRKADYIGKEPMIPSNGRGGCEEGYVDDCSGDGDCCPESWIGDGLFDCEAPNNYGCDLTCYDNDGGDCDETGDDGGTDGGTTGGSEDIEGCTDPNANNYEEDATIDDGSCTYPPLGELTFGAIDYNAGTLEINLDCEYAVSAFSFDPNLVVK